MITNGKRIALGDFIKWKLERQLKVWRLVSVLLTYVIATKKVQSGMHADRDETRI